jgi:hypothetical protein
MTRAPSTPPRTWNPSAWSGDHPVQLAADPYRRQARAGPRRRRHGRHQARRAGPAHGNPDRGAAEHGASARCPPPASGTGQRFGQAWSLTVATSLARGSRMGSCCSAAPSSPTARSASTAPSSPAPKSTSSALTSPGGTVDFSGAGDWSFPPAFPWTDTAPPGLKLSRKEDQFLLFALAHRHLVPRNRDGIPTRNVTLCSHTWRFGRRVQSRHGGRTGSRVRERAGTGRPVQLESIRRMLTTQPEPTCATVLLWHTSVCPRCRRYDRCPNGGRY